VTGEMLGSGPAKLSEKGFILAKIWAFRE